MAHKRDKDAKPVVAVQILPAMDLDQFLQTHPSTGKPAVIHAHGQPALPDADRVCLVGILADDSGSISKAGLTQAVVDGLNLSLEAFRGARGSDFFLDIRGFRQTYFQGYLRDVPETSPFNAYRPDGTTPLVACARQLLTHLHAKADQFRALGIPAVIALLIITDGLPEGDSMAPKDFRDIVRPTDHLLGIGIGDTARFHALFTELGIATILTPRAQPAEVRHSINQFSQSVASIASR